MTDHFVANVTGFLFEGRIDIQQLAGYRIGQGDGVGGCFEKLAEKLGLA